ncbi:MAG: bifunctional UDP-N-acetylglucosamine pyrophosphorylase/glucosamine-1-phosphate N-acetyltransferase [Gammaproteobacteria bacterium]|jgi:bifunctional UDP-N-acetylglucosamine pyrophosphorylase/glucosamine-1-phosphate N-acetyltransferase
MPLSIVILAAGQGTRMKSDRPKVLHLLAGKPMVQHVIDASLSLSPQQLVMVVGHKADQIESQLAGQSLTYVYQTEQLGTGHAVAQCVERITPGNDVLVLFGDVPLIRPETLQSFVSDAKTTSVNILSFKASNPFGYGRIVRNQHESVVAIVEEKDASEDERKICESNSGIIYIDGNRVAELVDRLDNNNAQQEYYLTDVVKHAVAAGCSVSASICDSADEVKGVNNQKQLSEVETAYRKIQAEDLMSEGVKLYDPARIDVRGTLTVGRDVEIDINCIFEGDVTLGDGVIIGANCVIRNSIIGDHCDIKPMTSIDETVLNNNVSIGPFARIRPGTVCADDVKIGNFVEVKKANIGKGSKISHLSYIGDTVMGRDVNIGAGTITCNYDGANKFITEIGDDVFVGSDSQLVAPVKIGKGATIGAGSTITKDTPADKLSLSRSRQTTIDNWVRPIKIKE